MQMKIKDQIRTRREALGMDMKQLADRIGVTEQAVRHWETGRSWPGKNKMHLVEQALSFSLDWSEGTSPSGKTAAAMIEQGDVELLMVICQLPLHMKDLLGDIARTHLEVVQRARGMEPPAAAPAPAAKRSGSRSKVSV